MFKFNPKDYRGGLAPGILILSLALSSSVAPAGSSPPDNDSIMVSAGKLQVIEAFPSKYIRSRRVYVWLPENYGRERRYQVLYMHDGQMLFDSTSTWNKQEWGVDEVVAKLMSAGRVRNFIVVGVDHAGTQTGRWLEYFPQKAIDYLPNPEELRHHPLVAGILGADRYLRFLVRELKPYIERHYAVFTGAEHSYLAGSSMGGLISLYAISEYPDEFAGAACLSTHWPGVDIDDEYREIIGDAVYRYFVDNLPVSGKHRIYFDHGTETLDAEYPLLQKRIDALVEKKGYSASDWQTRIFTGAAHVEKDWNARLHIPFEFLFKLELE